MTFEDVLDQAIAMLQRRGRITYRTLKRQFNLDNEALEDLKEELIEAEQLAVDQDGKMLVWMGDATSSPTPAPIRSTQERVSSPASAAARSQREPPLAYTPAYLTEKSSPPDTLWKANASRSRFVLPTSKTRRN